MNRRPRKRVKDLSKKHHYTKAELERKRQREIEVVKIARESNKIDPYFRQTRTGRDYLDLLMADAKRLGLDYINDASINDCALWAEALADYDRLADEIELAEEQTKVLRDAVETLKSVSKKGANPSELAEAFSEMAKAQNAWAKYIGGFSSRKRNLREEILRRSDKIGLTPDGMKRLMDKHEENETKRSEDNLDNLLAEA